MGRPERWPGRPPLRADRRPGEAGRRHGPGPDHGHRRLVAGPGARRLAGPVARAPQDPRAVPRAGDGGRRASTTALPLGVVRVLVADLIGQGRVTVLAARPAGEEPSTAMLKEVLNGLRAL